VGYNGVPMPVGYNGVPMGYGGVQPSIVQGYNNGHHPGHVLYYDHYSLGNRVRRFFGFAPDNNFRYKSRHGTWGFMGHSRRRKYYNAHGAEVDRYGRPVFIVN